VTSLGQGQDILFLHGYLSRKESFYYQIKFFSREYRVTAPDILGFGASSKIDSAMSVGDYAEWLEKFIEASGIKCPIIVAHSFVARVAIKYLSTHPQGAKKLVLCGGAGIVKPRSSRYIWRVKLYRITKKFFPKFAEKRFGSREYKTLSPIMRESYKKIVNEDLRICAQKIVCPTLLVYGKNDTATPADEEGKIFNNAIRQSTLVLMEGDHFCFCKHPQSFNELVDNFLKGC
jgi:pimeloyl-ACP methyl ester carboxylesterase